MSAVHQPDKPLELLNLDTSNSLTGFVAGSDVNPLKKFIKNFWEFFSSNRKRTGFIVILVLVAVVPLTVFIAQKQQELRQRAALEGSRIEIVGPNVANGVATSRNIKLKLTYIPAAVSPTETPVTTSSATPTTIPRTCGSPITACQADVNRDGVVTILDWSLMASSTCLNKPKPASGPCSLGDFNNNGIIDRQDVACVQDKLQEEVEQSCPENKSTTSGVQGVATAQEASTVLQFRVSNDQNTLEQAQVQSFTPEELTALTKEIVWQLTEGNGAKTVFAQFKFGDAAWESVLSTTVNLNESSTLSPTVSISPSSTLTAPTFLEDTSKLKILVVLVKAPDDNNPLVYDRFGRTQNIPLTKEYVRSMWFGSSPDVPSVSHFFRENSQGRLLLNENNVDIRDYVTISYLKDSCPGRGADNYPITINNLRDAAREAIVARDSVNLSDYTSIVYQMASWPRCGTATTGAGEINIVETDLQPLVHEIGHVFGLEHAADLSCDTRQIEDISRFQAIGQSLTSCSYFDTNDNSSVMAYTANLGLINFNAPERDLLGWIPQDKIRNVTTTQNITIYPLGSSQGPQVLKIPKRSGVVTLDSRRIFRNRYSAIQNYYYVSYRRPIGYDANLEMQYVAGSSLHLMTVYQYINSSSTKPKNDMKSILIQLQPGNRSMPTFRDGTVFRDDLDGFTITQNAHDDNSATLSIQFTVSAEPTPTTTATPQPTTSACGCADLDGDGTVTIPDYSLLASQTCWGRSEVNNPNEWTTNACANKDINGDRIINNQDYACLSAQWGQFCRR